MIKRILGKTNEKLSILGFGGILVMNETPDAAERLVAEAIDRGINYFDVAPTYGDAIDRLGPALKPYRKQVFLACKTLKRNKQEAALALTDSLTKLHTDYFDLYQIHGIASLDETKEALGPGGAIEAFSEAKQKGLIKYLGFSAHDTESALYAIDHYDFDTILFPVNFVLYYSGNFGSKIRDAAVNKNMGLLALKSMAKTGWPESMRKNHPYPKCWYEPLTNPELINLALRFTLSEPVTALLTPGEETLFRIALDFIEQGFSPLTASERANLQKIAQSLSPLFNYDKK
jgi:predicted aldo/keto reductase-like oxidoreductase